MGSRRIKILVFWVVFLVVFQRKQGKEDQGGSTEKVQAQVFLDLFSTLPPTANIFPSFQAQH